MLCQLMMTATFSPKICRSLQELHQEHIWWEASKTFLASKIFEVKRKDVRVNVLMTAGEIVKYMFVMMVMSWCDIWIILVTVESESQVS